MQRNINRDGIWAIVAIAALLILGLHLQSRGLVFNIDRETAEFEPIEEVNFFPRGEE